MGVPVRPSRVDAADMAARDDLPRTAAGARASVRRALAGFSLAALAFALACLLLGTDYALGQATLVATYAIAGLGVVLIVGQAGQIVLGQGALVALGAYAECLLAAAGWPPLLSLPAAVALGACGGAVASLPARRLGGLYFGMSTLAFALVVEEVLTRWSGLTQGAAGMLAPAFGWGGWRAQTPLAQFLVSLVALALAWAVCRRLLRSRLGRAWRAIREDEAAAAACGVDLARAKSVAFILGGGVSAFGGAFYAHWIGFISPEQFGLMLSFELLMLVFLGGVGRLSGALWGALVIVSVPQLIAVARDALPGEGVGSAGLEMALFGAVIVGVVLWRLRGEKRRGGSLR